MELGFLRPQERRTVGLALAAGACIWGGYILHGLLIPDAKAADIGRIERMERVISRLDRNLTRVLDKLGIEEKPAP